MFNIGAKVKWSSQAQGYVKEKVGVVVQVVPAGERPDRERYMHLYKNSGCGFGRNHVSYVVMVKNTPYWPVVKKLELVGEEKTLG